MKLRDKKLETSIRKHWFTRLKASPELYKEYRRNKGQKSVAFPSVLIRIVMAAFCVFLLTDQFGLGEVSIG